MKTEIRTKITVGIVVAAAIVTFIIATLSIGNREGWLSSKTEYCATFTRVEGLQSGSPVWLMGVRIGSVDDVLLPDNPDEEKVTVKMEIESKYSSWITSATVAQIKTQGVLGDKYISLSVNKDIKDPVKVKDGCLINTSEPVDYQQMTRQGGDVVTNLASISSSLVSLLNSIEKGEGVLGKLLADPEFGQKSIKNIEVIIDDAKLLVAKINNSEGLAGKLIADEEYGNRVSKDLEEAVSSLRYFVEQLGNENTLAGRLLQTSEENSRIVDDLKATTNALKIVSEGLSKKEGLLGKLLADKEDSEKIYEDIRKITSNLASITEKIDRGEGSLGGFVNDPSVYEGISDIIKGVENSRIFKWYIRKKMKSGEKQRTEEVPGIQTEDGLGGTKAG